MDFIETIFGISPDGGSGASEILLFLIPIAGMLALRVWRRMTAADHSQQATRRDSL